MVTKWLTTPLDWTASTKPWTLNRPMVQTVDVIPILSAEQLEACWLEGLKVLAPDDSVWRASAYCGGPGFWSSHKHGVWWQDLWERYGDTLRILGPSLRYHQGQEPQVVQDLLDFRRRCEGHFRVVTDPGWALRLLGIRDQVHPNDVYASLWDDEALAQEAMRWNQEDPLFTTTYGPVTTDGGLLNVIDLRHALRHYGVPTINPAVPDTAQRQVRYSQRVG